MAKRKRPPAEKFYDRVAGLYDTIYEGNPYWETVFEITWRHMKKFLPRDHNARCLDLGCGTGRWGLKLLKSGYPTDFLDISQKMIDQVGKKIEKLNPAARPELYKCGVDDMGLLPDSRYDFVVGQGDPLGCAERPERAFKEIDRILAPGGVAILSVDNRYAGFKHYLERGDVEGLRTFLKNGRTRWVTDAEDERYPLVAFRPADIRRLVDGRGFELLSLIGKTALPLRRYQELLKDRQRRQVLLRLEESLHAEEALLGCAAHLEFAARKPLPAT